MADQYKNRLQMLKDVSNVKEQISIVREVCTSLKSSQEDITPVLQLLVDIYLTFPSKHQVKRIIISAFQNLSSTSCDFVIQELTNQLRFYYKQCLDKTDTDLRKYIDIIGGLMDNFPLGERCLNNLCIETLQFVSQILSKFLTENRTTQSSVKQNELMHNCLASIQSANRILQKCFTTLTNQKEEDITAITSVFLKHDINILHTDDFLMDCKTTCAINVILLIRFQHPNRFVKKVVKYIFEEGDIADDDKDNFIKPIRGDNLTCKMCLLYGTMSILELSELVEELHDGKCLLLDYLFTSIIQITEKGYIDSINKLLSVKCYNMWTAKSSATLKSGLLSDKQKDLLQGNGQIIQSLMSYVWTVWEDSTDVIRMIAREIFENVLKIHTMASTSDIGTDPFLQSLTKKLMFDVPWSSKGKYGMLCILIQIIGTINILQHAPDLSTTILSQMSEHSLACHASDLYIQMCWKHQTESADTWMSVWIDPTLKVLSGSDKQQISNVIEYILTKLLKKGKALLPYILEKLSTQTDSSQMSSLVMCLRRAKVLGLLDKQLESPQNVNALINISVLQEALCHIDEQVRLDAFAFVCESHKTTAVVNQWELQLIKYFLPWNLNSQSPAFRQQILSLLRKLICRMKESENVMLRQVKKSNDKQSQICKDGLTQYKLFLSWLTRHLLSCLYPGSSFARRTICLSALTLLVEILGTSSSGFTVNDELVSGDFNILVDCLTDTFEDNKMEAYKLLKHWSDLDIMKQTFESVDDMFETALNLACSPRPQDSTTAAYLFKVLLIQREFFSVMLKSRSFIGNGLSMSKISENQSDEVSHEQPPLPKIPDSQSGRVLHLLLWLSHYLKYQIDMAKQSLMKAACNKPLYPTLHSIRYVMQDVVFRSIPVLDIPYWKEFVGTLINYCLQISQIVSPVVQNSSPEGNIPEEVIGDLKGKFEDETIMPEYLTVCCWRSIKEVSLLLGQLCTNVPIIDPSRNDSVGLLTCHQIDEIGCYFKTQLLESIHRGAFELAYAGFVKMCDMLWRSSIEDLYKLPKLWLSQLIMEIKSVSSKLCATRRSAGVPFYVQALVTTEPATTGRHCFKQAMSDLLALALTKESDDMSEPKVHSLNILRAMYRDTRLGEDVTPFVCGGLQAAILGFKSKFWAVCNSSTLLFSALMTRIFGVKRSKDESNISKKNCQTGKAFFHKYPGLYNFMLHLLAEATENVGEHRTVHLHPSLYPLLMVLARLFPSPLEGTDTSLNLSCFIPFILKCSDSAVHKTRQMSAKALQPLVVGNSIINVVSHLLHKLPVCHEHVHYSQIHGILLQMNSLMELLPSLDTSFRQCTIRTVINEWLKRTWLLSKLNACFVVRKEALILTSKLLTESSFELNENTKILNITMSKFLDEERFLLTEPYKQTGPGYIEYLTTLSYSLLFHWERECYHSKHCDKGDNSIQYCDKGDNSIQYCDKGDNSSQYCVKKGDNSFQHCDKEDNYLETTLLLILDSCHYEVRMIGLVYLHGVSSDEELGEELVFNCVVRPVEKNVATKIMSSSRVLKKLIQMVTEEQHFECQKLVFKALKHHPSICDYSWFDDKFQLVQIFKHCLHYIETCSRDELRAEMIELTGFLVRPMLECVIKGKTTSSEEEGQDLLIQWKDLLHYYKGTEQHYQLQLSVIKVLYNNTDILLTDSSHLWGDNIFTFWDILVNLLQEDDDEVKTIASRVVHKLNSEVQETVHPFMALDLAVGSMLQCHYRTNWTECWKLLLRWMNIPEDDQMGEGGRLFDKNEMNTWRDDVQLVKIVTKYLTYLILLFDNCTNSDFSWEESTGESKLENKDVFGNETEIMVDEAKSIDSLKTENCASVWRLNREKVLTLHSYLMEQFPTNHPLTLVSCSIDNWASFCNILHTHLASLLQNDNDIPSNHFKDVNKYIQSSINQFKVDSVLQLYDTN